MQPDGHPSMKDSDTQGSDHVRLPAQVRASGGVVPTDTSPSATPPVPAPLAGVTPAHSGRLPPRLPSAFPLTVPTAGLWLWQVPGGQEPVSGREPRTVPASLACHSEPCFPEPLAAAQLYVPKRKRRVI